MTDNVNSLLERHLSDLLGREAALCEQLSPIRVDIDATRRAIASANGKVPPSNGFREPSHEASIAKLTIKQLVMRALRQDLPSGATARQMLALFTEWGRPEVKRTSLSPQLTRLKDDHLITREGERWHAVKEAADVS